jgi:cytochrome P450
MDPIPDAFRAARKKGPILKCEFQGEVVPMILRHEDARKVAKDWKTFSSDAPFRVPIPSEEKFRSVRQLPVETNPPEHTEYREIVEPFFRRPKDPAMIAQVEALIAKMIGDALTRNTIEIVREFALPLQSRALTYLLKVPESEAEVWIGWGTHIFREGAGAEKGAALEIYLQKQLDDAAQNPGDDFFSALTQARFRGRALTREEMLGFANLTFASGRDTIIQMVAFTFGYLGKHPEALDFLRQDPKRIVNACEEIFRALTPLTHIARVCPVETDVHGSKVPPNGRVAICWASANMDENVFDAPGEMRLDRKPNPHVAFGSGPHLCIGAAHARLILRTLLQACVDRVGRISILTSEDHVENEAEYRRVAGYDSLTVSIFASCRP